MSQICKESALLHRPSSCLCILQHLVELMLSDMNPSDLAQLEHGPLRKLFSAHDNGTQEIRFERCAIRVQLAETLPVESWFWWIWWQAMLVFGWRRLQAADRLPPVASGCIRWLGGSLMKTIKLHNAAVSSLTLSSDATTLAIPSCSPID